jgi:hypothetical protein
MTPYARIAHRTRSRVRLSIPEKRRDRDYFAEARKQIAALPGVTEVRANSVTGSLLVVHPELSFEDLEPKIEQQALFRLGEPPMPADAPLDSNGLPTRGMEEAGFGTMTLESVLFLVLMLFAGRKYPRASLIVGLVPVVWQAGVLALNVYKARREETDAPDLAEAPPV